MQTIMIMQAVQASLQNEFVISTIKIVILVAILRLVINSLSPHHSSTIHNCSIQLAYHNVNTSIFFLCNSFVNYYAKAKS